jgi:hypothetical protein
MRIFVLMVSHQQTIFEFVLTILMALSADIMVAIAQYLSPIDLVRLAQSGPGPRQCMVNKRYAMYLDELRHRAKFASCLQIVGSIKSKISEDGKVHKRVLAMHGREAKYKTAMWLDEQYLRTHGRISPAREYTQMAVSSIWANSDVCGMALPNSALFLPDHVLFLNSRG